MFRLVSVFLASVQLHLLIGWLLVTRAPHVEPADLSGEGALLGETMAIDLDPGVLEQEESVALAEARAEAQAAPIDPRAGADRPADPLATERRTSATARRPNGPRASTNETNGHEAAPGNAPSGNRGTFGAVGDRAAADLATAFVRGFPQVASVDAAWAKVPFGSLGVARVDLELSEEGRIVGHRVQGAQAPLDRAIERTLALLRGRKFTAKGAHTKLTLRTQVTADTVHDGLHGNVFAIGASFVGVRGNAFFALASGRRIDIDVSTP